MLRLRDNFHNLFLLLLATVGAGAPVRAQQDAAPNALPVILNQKQAATRVLSQTTPEYPPVAKANYIEGLVKVEITVDQHGKVNRAHVLEGNAVLAVSAQQAISQWIYRPLETPLGQTGFVATVRMKFNLHHEKIELTPQRAEQDFLRQVKPPQLVHPPEDTHSGDVVHMHALVNDQGQVVDMKVSPADGPQVEAARDILRGWAFRPAHWGNLPVASYVEIDVPLGTRSIARVTPGSDAR
jgi:TonB family protein